MGTITRSVERFREPHRITRVFVPDDDGFRPFDKDICGHCGIRIYQYRDGTYRHDLTEVRQLTVVHA